MCDVVVVNVKVKVKALMKSRQPMSIRAVPASTIVQYGTS